MTRTKIGENAGEIWKALDKENNKRMAFQQLKRATQLEEKDVYLALGWLYKENKVHFDGNETNGYVHLTEFGHYFG
jgi:hypothetical protein